MHLKSQALLPPTEVLQSHQDKQQHSHHSPQTEEYSTVIQQEFLHKLQQEPALSVFLEEQLQASGAVPQGALTLHSKSQQVQLFLSIQLLIFSLAPRQHLLPNLQ